jgi:bacillopeptidase F (M6 metalloprotease family)
VGSNYGNGYSGRSDWTSHIVHLDDYAGKKILVRFQYVTDAAVHLDGMLIKAARLSKNGEPPSSEHLKWIPSGFVLVDDILEQKFLVQIVKKMKSGQYIIDGITLDDSNETLYTIREDENLDTVTVVVSGMTGLTQQPAVFDLEVSEIFAK